MVDFFSSVFNNYKSKITNPFFGTLITVWIVRNWSIVYAFFMFDQDRTMQNKIDYINEYFEQKDFWSELGINLGLTFALLIFTYFLLSVGRSLSDLYYKRCEPWIITKIDKIAILTEADKLRLEKRVELLISKNISISNDLTSSEDSNRYVSEQLTKTRAVVEDNTAKYNKKVLELKEDLRMSSELSEICDPVTNDFKKTIDEVFNKNNILNNNLITGSMFLDNLEARKILIKKGYVVMIGRNPEYTVLGKSFIKFYDFSTKIPF